VGNKPLKLQNTFLNQARKEGLEITVYLSNGLPLRGKVLSYDSFTILLENDKKQNLIYKHAVSTIVPSRPLSYSVADEEE
jgi:host factor-I protein